MGQSIDIRHLAKYINKSRQRYRKMLGEDVSKDIIETLIKKEVADGIQTFQYQINTLLTVNGQSPFLTVFLNLVDDEYVEDTALIIEEFIKQRIKGIKNKKGVYITPAFPKLIYVLHEHNNLSGGKYDYLTKLCAECSTKRMYPDYISAKKMKENYEGNVFSAMGCRSFLSPWKDENGEYKFEGRYNKGVVSLNIVQAAIISEGDEKRFFEILDNRLDICFEALMYRHNFLKGTLSDVSPIHWQHGAIARLKAGETIDKLLDGAYSTISLGYIGLFETTKVMKGVSHTDPIGTEFALKLMNYLRAVCDKWKKETGLGFALYSTPAESLCYRFCKIDKQKFGIIKDVTDKGFYTNSYHVYVSEQIDAFTKLKFESQFQAISSGGCISYVEIPNMKNNLEAVETMIKFIYENIMYAEFNTRADYCHECGYDGEIKVKNDKWYCPNCGNTDHDKMNVVRRTCGYIGENFWNEGKTAEIEQRVLHL